MCMSVCMSFQVLTQLGGCTNYSRKEMKGSGGRLRIIYPIYSSWGAEKEKTPPRIVSYQYRMLGWVSVFSLWDTRSRHKYYCSVRPA